MFTETEDPTTIEKIENLESLTNLKFPTEYKQHLLKYNGGRCTPNVFYFLENKKEQRSAVDWFLAIYDGQYDNLYDYIHTYKIEQKRIPSHMLPIAHDAGGNLVCISCGDEDYGHIYFWDHEKEVDYDSAPDTDYSNLYLIATGFKYFIENLTS